MKILFIEDDKYTSELFSALLAAHRYAVDGVSDGAAGLEMATQWRYDLILLDIMLPTLDGIEVCRRLRAQGCQTPILMLTVKDTDEDAITGLDAGADDYVSKSCHSAQFLARVRALLRRSGHAALPPVLTWGQLCLNPAAAQVTYQQKTIALRPKEYSLLELFLRHPHRVFSRSNIIDHLWSIEETPVEGSITNLIKDLRQRLKCAGMFDDLIETVYGLGYRLKAAPVPDEEVQLAMENAGTAVNGGNEVLPLSVPVDRDDDWNLREQRGRAAIRQITEHFQVSLEQRIAALEAIERSFLSGDWSLQQQESARIQAHKLAGGLGTFGYAKASKIARSVEHLLDVQVSQETQLVTQFSQLLKELRQELTQSTEPPIAQPSLSRR
ncbi:response regulator [Egbenema bharatensis]|uniref:response regulator n=1 Tax=Egbenema bharatensis TaxID=3463334 RepID=UPI003A8A6198